MNLDELKAELSVKSIELEQALDAGLSHSHLVKLYREMKELQYQLLMEQVRQTQLPPAETIE